MKCLKYIEKYSNANKKMRNIIICGVATSSLAAGAYIGIKKAIKMKNNKAEYDEDEIEEIFKEKERMKFYEDEFIRQEEEEEELKKAVEEFNSKRLTRKNCPHCGKKKNDNK